jgi:hypothetical protein
LSIDPIDLEEMATVLILTGADLGDERSVEMHLRYGYLADDDEIDAHMHAAIDRAREMRAEAEELEIA